MAAEEKAHISRHETTEVIVLENQSCPAYVTTVWSALQKDEDQLIGSVMGS